MTTLAEFRATGIDSSDLGVAIGDEVLDGIEGRAYLDGTLYIERAGEQWTLTIGNQSEIGALSDLEAMLYSFAIGEGYFGEDASVLGLFLDRFPGFAVEKALAEALDGMPLDSNCGRDCEAAIEAAAAFAEHARKAWGEGYPGRVSADDLARTAAEICATYIAG